MSTTRQSVIHKLIHDKLIAALNHADSILERKKVRTILYNSHVPVKLHNHFLKEMETFGLIKIENKQKVKITPPKNKSD